MRRATNRAMSNPPLIVSSTPTTASSSAPRDHTSADAGTTTTSQSRRRRFSRANRQEAKHIRLQALNPGTRSSASSIYYGSFNRSPRQSRTSITTPSPRVSMSHSHLEGILQDDPDLDTYGVEEVRDGFFDGVFVKPAKRNPELDRVAKQHPLSLESLLPQQWHAMKDVVRDVTTTRVGIRLMKSFLAFFIAYVLCLMSPTRNWLGRYSYIMVLSTIINHPGRTMGAQLDGAILTTVGTAGGLGWGAFALWLSGCTPAAERGYGGILAAFLIVFMGSIAALRSYYIRLYQLVLASGLSLIYTCLADTSEAIRWGKLFDYGIPWLLGQVLSLVVCCAVFPDAGARPLAVALHRAFGVMQEGLSLPQPDSPALHRQLAVQFVGLSAACRDLTLDISITRFPPSDVLTLRNLMQAVIRCLLSLGMETAPFDKPEEKEEDTGPKEVVIDVDGSTKRPPLTRTNTAKKAVNLVTSKLADPTASLLSSMRNSLERCDAVLMDMSGYRKYLGPPPETSTDITGVIAKIRKSMIKYDEAEDSLMDNPTLPPTYSNHPEVIELFLFVHPIRQAAKAVENLLLQVMVMQQQRRGWRVYLPSYSFVKGLQRTNAQVRHDRGGLTVGFFFQSQASLGRVMKGMANVYKPLRPYQQDPDTTDAPGPFGMKRTETIGRYEEENDQNLKEKPFRYQLWMVLHRLQGFETRFALKVIIMTSLLAIPGWLPQSRGWWNQNESFWAVGMVWIMAHPRVGGNFQDLLTRAFCGVLGAIWGAFAYAAREGNPYVMAVFAAIYMIPMLYRFTLSKHPRSGIVGCFSFVVVSFAEKADQGQPSVVHVAWTRGLAFVIGVVTAVVVSWSLWPFVARNELRKALSSMMIYSSIIYRGVVARYIYYDKGDEPGVEDIKRSEMLEGRLREGFFRMREIMALTQHEIRLRGPFNATPYSALIDACEGFFEYLVSLRQASLFFHPHLMHDNKEATETLFSYRRDAVAAILMNLYVLAGALRGNRKVPRYLPSAAISRKRLLDKMAEVEAALAHTREIERIQSRGSEGEGRRWSQIYSYSYSQNLTGCVKQLEQLIVYTKEIVGEQGFGPVLEEFDVDDAVGIGRVS
ncbi:hypothetical protein BJ875DRAFT_468715 [Amylocarpus encephaloides]|uniref:Uncharacterized protein n=1 Tax=Amylocarpus encephaloides TaxID=45428 RepID=A0A9P7YDH0_9HELO|nr:hypothetical protein BJ875DRAFT_468715 [Amylocarpus encephaloides]